VTGAMNDGTWAGKFDRPETWAEFDRLPLPLKRLYWHAPYRYTAMPAVRAVQRHEGCWKTPELMEADVRREALRLYGPDHPQAQGLMSGFVL
jgi:hypothetical protein